MASSKKQGQRLIPEYLLKYATELEENHPDPSASWGGGGGGGDYTAGEGIDITGDVISIDEEVVAKKTDIPDVSDFVTETSLSTTLEDYELKSEAFSGSYDDLTDKPTLFSGDYEDLTNKPDLSIYAESADLATVATTGDYTDLLNKPTIPTKTSDLTNDSGFITGVSWNDVSGKPTFATVATSGDYDDLLNKPTIPTVDYPVTDVQVDGVSVVANKVASITMPTVPTKTSELQNDSGFITASSLSGYATETWVENKGYLTSVSWNDVSNKPTFATVATSGSYNDLTDKPTIPSSTDFVDLISNQTIGGSKTFSSGIIETHNNNSGSGDTHTYITTIHADEIHLGDSLLGGTDVHLVYPTKTNGIYTLATTDDIPSTIAWANVTGKPTFATVATSGSYNDLTDKPTIPTVPVTDVQLNGTSILSGTVANITGLQETLVSGTNIKTINNQSILGSGNITISGSAAPYEITAMTVDSTNNTITLTITANE